MPHDEPLTQKNPRFRCPTPTVHDDGSPVPAEWGLRCPKCDYDLTGLTKRRCPECGHIFDPHAIWIANKHKQAGLGHQTPAYVIYGALFIGLVVFSPLIVDRPLMLLPLGILPVFEGLAFFLNRKVGEVRAIVVALAVVFCIIIRAW